MFVHGFGSSRKQWTKNLASLSQSNPVYALDLLGFGASQKVATVYQTDLWAEQLHAFWQQFIGRPVILVGHSLGALVASTAASLFPEAFKGVVLMTLPATRQERVSNAWVQRLSSVIEKGVANPLIIRLIFNIARQRALIRAALKSAYVNSACLTDAVVDEFVAPTRDRGAAQTLCRLTQSVTTPAYSQSRERLLEKLHQPVLVLWGTGDRIIPPSQGHRLREQFPHFTWVDVPNAGHCLYDECADTVNTLISNWIGDRAL
jgi:pimeloyl-ACP methyl ester carboxylesterase